MESQRVGHNWGTKHIRIHTHTHIWGELGWEEDLFKELAHVIVWATKSEIYMAVRQAGGNSSRSWCYSWRQCGPNSLFLRGPQSFFLRSSTDWMGPTHIMKGNLLYLKATDLNVNHILRTPSQQHLGWYLTKNWYQSLAKLTPNLPITHS